MWVSWIGLIVTGGLSYFELRLAARNQNCRQRVVRQKGGPRRDWRALTVLLRESDEGTE